MNIGVFSARRRGSGDARVDGRAAEPDRENCPARAGGPARLLLIDRDRHLSVLLAELLVAHGYSVRMAEDAQEVENVARDARLDLIIVDLGGAGRIERLRRLCQRACRRVFVVSANTDEADRIALLENGAVDCLSKPFNPRELLLRVRAVLWHRAGYVRDELGTLKVGPLALDAAGQMLIIGERELELTGAEARLLELLMWNAGRTVLRGQLTEYALGRSALPYERSLDTHIRNLRGKLGSDSSGRTPIKTLRGAGYLLLPHWDPV